MRQLCRLLMLLVGAGVVVVGARVFLIGHRLPPQLVDGGPHWPKVVWFLLYIGVGIGFIWMGLSGRQRNPVPANPAFGWAFLRNLGLVPLVTYGVLIAFACYAWLQVGHWPYYAHPDPKDLPHPALGYITGIFFLLGALSIFLVPVALLVGGLIAARRKDASSPMHRATVLYLTGASLWLLDYGAERTDLPWKSVIGWFID